MSESHTKQYKVEEYNLFSCSNSILQHQSLEFVMIRFLKSSNLKRFPFSHHSRNQQSIVGHYYSPFTIYAPLGLTYNPQLYNDLLWIQFTTPTSYTYPPSFSPPLPHYTSLLLSEDWNSIPSSFILVWLSRSLGKLNL